MSKALTSPQCGLSHPCHQTEGGPQVCTHPPRTAPPASGGAPPTRLASSTGHHTAPKGKPQISCAHDTIYKSRKPIAAYEH